MKKFLRMLLIGCVCIFTTFGVISCAEATNATPESPAGETNTGNQTPNEPTTPDTPATPVVPEEPTVPNDPSEPEVHQHTYGNWFTVTEPTCTKTGLQQRNCTGENCESFETAPIATIDHDYEEVIKEATCIVDGSKTYTCACGHSKSEVIAATGHDHKFVETIAPTCTEKGYDLHRCHCGDEIRTNEKAASGHNYNAETHQCQCGLFQSPMEDLVDSYWFYTGTGSTKWAIYFETLDGVNGTYCSYKGTVVNGVFTINFESTHKYGGTFTVDEKTGIIIFNDTCLKEEEQYNPTFTLTFSGDQVNGVFELNGNFKDTESTFKFIGYK